MTIIKDRYDHDYDDCDIHNCDCWEEKIEKLRKENKILKTALYDIIDRGNESYPMWGKAKRTIEGLK